MKEIPQNLACSGASEVGVMPGCVFVSSNFKPKIPWLSSHLKSVRVYPLQPKPLWATRAYFLHALKSSSGISAGKIWLEPFSEYLAL